MEQYCINRKRIRKLCIPKTYDLNKVQIGIPVMDDEAEKVGLVEVGDIVLPSGIFGPQSKKNAYGYTYADKTREKERRYITTNWVYPYGNTDASKVAADIYRECYPKIEAEPYGIELQLYEGENNQQFVIINITDEIRKQYMKEAINLLLEIYGICYVYNGVVGFEKTIKKRRCNWEILPPGEMTSKHVKEQLKTMNQNTDTYDIERLNYVETYDALEMVEGINGFRGYYAYLYENYCVLESAFYGNATCMNPDKEKT
ncbi:hypothetical protein AALC25_16435 [Lachnospiraceae bacterium 29-84]